MPDRVRMTNHSPDAGGKASRKLWTVRGILKREFHRRFK